MSCSRFRHFKVLAVAALLLVAGAACEQDDTGALRTIIGDSLSPVGPADPCVKAADEDRLIADMLERVNRERQRRNLSPVKRNDTLDRIAEFYACRLIDGGFFSHEDPDDHSKIDSRAGDFGYAFRKIGENLGAGQYSVEQVMREWMRSPGHRANILDPEFTEVGLAVRVGGEHGVYWVQEFGRPLTSKPITESGDDPKPASKNAGTMSEMKEVPANSSTTQPGDGHSSKMEPMQKDSAGLSSTRSDDVDTDTDSVSGDDPTDAGEGQPVADALFADEWDVVLALIESN